MSYYCDHCGKQHPGWPKGVGWPMPDEFRGMSDRERFVQGYRLGEFLAAGGGGHYVLAMAPLEVTGRPDGGDPDGVFLSLWVRISKASHDAIVAIMRGDDFEGHGHYFGHLANHVPALCASPKEKVEVVVNYGEEPMLLPAGKDSKLESALDNGISHKQLHDILQDMGFFD